MNQSDLYHMQQEVWIYDQLQPEERLYIGRRTPRPVPGYAIPFPENLIKNAPPELTDQQLEERQDDFLRAHGINLKQRK